MLPLELLDHSEKKKSAVEDWLLGIGAFKMESKLKKGRFSVKH